MDQPLASVLTQRIYLFFTFAKLLQKHLMPKFKQGINLSMNYIPKNFINPSRSGEGKVYFINHKASFIPLGKEEVAVNPLPKRTLHLSVAKLLV
jgi:hypothetical protein